jgi:hypothetical protein
MALRAGARGYVLKDADEEGMVLSIRAVGKGEANFSPAIATRGLAYFAASPRGGASPQAFPTLTDRERVIHTHPIGEIKPTTFETLTRRSMSRKLWVWFLCCLESVHREVAP